MKLQQVVIHFTTVEMIVHIVINDLSSPPVPLNPFGLQLEGVAINALKRRFPLADATNALKRWAGFS